MKNIQLTEEEVVVLIEVLNYINDNMEEGDPEWPVENIIENILNKLEENGL